CSTIHVRGRAPKSSQIVLPDATSGERSSVGQLGSSTTEEGRRFSSRVKNRSENALHSILDRSEDIAPLVSKMGALDATDAGHSLPVLYAMLVSSVPAVEP